MTRKEIIKESSSVLRDCVTEEQAIRAGMRIAACRMLSGTEASARGCLKAADDLAESLRGIMMSSTTLSHRLARLCARRDWESLWMLARREVYPSLCA